MSRHIKFHFLQSIFWNCTFWGAMLFWGATTCIWKLVALLKFWLLFETFWWKMSQNQSNGFLDIDKRWFFCVKCRHYGKIWIFRKWPLGPFYDPPCPLTSCRKSEKSNERILRNVHKTLFLDRHLVYFWTRPGMNASLIAWFACKVLAVLIVFIIWHILMKNE